VQGSRQGGGKGGEINRRHCMNSNASKPFRPIKHLLNNLD
jgi:hypothetical protein